MNNNKGKITAIVLLSVSIVLALCGVAFGLVKIAGNNSDNVALELTKQVILEGDGTQIVQSQEEAYQYLIDNAGFFGITNPENTLYFKEESEALGCKYYNFGQTYNGNIPIYGNCIIIMTDSNGKVIISTGVYENIDEDIDLTSKVGENTLKDSVEEYLLSEYGFENIKNIEFSYEQEVLSEENKIIYPQDDKADVLAYEFDVNFDSDSGWNDFHVIANANDGQIYSAWSNILNESKVYQKNKNSSINVSYNSAENNYMLYDEERKIQVFDATKKNTLQKELKNIDTLLEKYKITSENNENWPDDAVIMMDKLSKIYDWYSDNIGIDGYANNDNILYAFYNDGFDDGNNGYSTSASDNAIISVGFNKEIIDVVGHEYGHLVMEAEGRKKFGRFNSTGETGAIGEAFADVMNEIIEGKKPDWKNSSRNIKNPSDTGNPDKILGSNYITPTDKSKSNDYGGIHANSTILSHASYIMYCGFNNINVDDEKNNGALTSEQIGELWYRTVQLVTKPDISFQEFGRLMNLLAKVMYKEGTLTSAQYACVGEALETVGIFPKMNITIVNNNFDLFLKDFYGSNLDEATLKVYRAAYSTKGGFINSKFVEKKLTDENGNIHLELEEGEYYYLELTDNKYTQKENDVIYIYCTNKGKQTGIIDVTDFREDVVKDFEFEETEFNLAVNENEYIDTKITPKGISDEYYDVEWSTSDDEIVEIDKNNGKMTGVAEGTATVTATLTNKGKNETFENTFVQEATVTVTKKQRDTVLVLDCSGSMRGTPLEEMKKSATKFCEAILNSGGDNRIEIITYDNSVEKSGFKSSLSELENYIDNIIDGGRTNMYSAMKQADTDLKNSSRKNSIRNVVVMSDGIPNEGTTSNNGVMTNWSNANSTNYYSYDTASRYGNAVCSLSDTLKDDYNIYSLGFFHTLYDDDKAYCSYLMNYIQNNGYYEVDEAENLQISFENISGQVSNGSKIVINIACPVDVTVNYGDETLSSKVVNYCDTASFGILKKVGVGNDIKVLELDKDKEYDISITGTGSGTMDYSITYYDENDAISDCRIFENVPITVNTLITGNTSQTTDTALEIDSDGNGKIDSIWTAGANSDGRQTWSDETAIDEVEMPIVQEEDKMKNNSIIWIVLIICCTLVIITAIIALLIIILKKEEISAVSGMPTATPQNYANNYTNYTSVQNQTLPQNNVDSPNNTYTPDNTYNQNSTYNYNQTVAVVNGVQILDGPMRNQKFALKSGYPFAIGKDPGRSKIVIDRSFVNVSRLHCTVEFSGQYNKYYVTDCSSNGTFLVDGTRLQKGKRTAIEKGTVIYLATDKCRIRLL